MGSEMSTAWFLIALLASGIGTGIFIYGYRQKQALPLVFGMVIGAYPMLVKSAWLAGAVGAGLLALFVFLQRRT